MNRKTKITLLSTLIGGLAILAAGYFCITRYVNAPSRNESPEWLYLPAGTSREALADTLRSRLGDKTADRTMTIYQAIAPDSAKIRGAYRIAPGTSSKEIARRLAKQRQTPVRVTFNNIRTLNLLAERLSAKMEFESEEFLAACDSVLPAAGFQGREQFPAAFLPDTYELYWTTPAAKTLERLLEERNRFWSDERRAQAKALGLTPVEVATVASIVEEETQQRDERGTVARLYLNRIHRGMKLQADPTVKFAVGNFSLRRILSKHLKTPSAYNTYLNEGLPPGPIRIPEATTLDAVLQAPDHDYLYMCAKEDFSGRHNFSKDYATHQANARRYQRALNARGIK